MIEFGDDIREVFLQPGGFYFGGGRTRISTLLGSCISITLWHPARRIGGMCHFMLPTRGQPAGAPLDGRYADEALALRRYDDLAKVVGLPTPPLAHYLAIAAQVQKARP